MSKNILVLNVEVSGMNKYLFSQLRKRGWNLTIVDVPFPKIAKCWALISTFQPNVPKWKKRYSERLEKLYKTPWVFQQRSKFCQRKIAKLNGNIDSILQISGMFAPYTTHKDYTIMLSYTMALSNGYPAWAASNFDKWLKLEKDLYQNAKLIFTTNENARKSLIDDYGVREEKAIKVGYGLTQDTIPEFTKSYDGKTILFIGMDFERKGGYVLLEAFKEVRKQIADAKLIIVGPNKEIFKINQPGVELLGCIRDKQKIEELYKQASIFAMPSLCEPFGLVFLEAMSYKLPCIGTTIDAMPEIIEDGKTGFLVPPKDVDKLAEKIITLLNNSHLLEKMGQEAQRRTKESFHWDNVGEKIDYCLKGEKYQ